MMRRNLTLFLAVIAHLLFGNLAAAQISDFLELEGVSLEMTANQVRAAMQARGNPIAGKDKDDRLKYKASFQDLVSVKREDPKRFTGYTLTSKLRYETERGHLLVSFMPFVDRLVVVSARLYSNDVPWLGRSIPDCVKFMDKMGERYDLDINTNASQGQSRYSSKQKPMKVDGQMREDGQILSFLCSPRTMPQILLRNPHAQDLLMQQIDQALSK
ncbi:MAG: hypothetical protein ABJP02_03595 [Parasphingorhabdus sp.]|uniref:hypothetical protein n=1 Tax=Parasphingorhabdus sp. TaxID=2709688 RepID=UPI0032969439